MLSQRSRYALKALLHLAASDRSISVASIAAAASIPRKFLEGILNDLRRGALVTSTRGAAGGYRLARSADRISFGEVIRAMEGPLALVPCVSVNFYKPCRDCVDEASCALRRVMALAREGLASVLDGMTLASALNGDTSRDAAMTDAPIDGEQRAGGIG